MADRVYTDTQTDAQTHRQTHRHIYRRKDTQIDIHTDRKVKTEGPKILSNEFYIQTVIIDGPIKTSAIF